MQRVECYLGKENRKFHEDNKDHAVFSKGYTVFTPLYTEYLVPHKKLAIAETHHDIVYSVIVA